MSDHSIVSPKPATREAFRDAKAAVAQLIKLYDASTTFLCETFTKAMREGHPGHRFRAYYPEVRITTTSFAQVDSRLAFGHVSSPGTHAATITRPDLFAHYLEQQIGLLIENHDVAVQNHVLFTNYQFYVSEFEAYARSQLADPASGYTSFVSTGNIEITEADAPLQEVTKMPQMPTYHLKKEDGSGITLVNIGVGPSNAKTAADHIAVLRPHAWLMVGHCAGLRNSQSLGDFVLAHAYLREDKVLDDDLPVWVPIPALAEMQIALETAVAEVTELEGYDLKRIMRTGTVASVDNRNWELRDQDGPVQRLSQSRAVALDMESATIAANGFRFRVPYGTLLCVSDKPLHGELKLPGMASDFYTTQVARHLMIGIRAMEQLAQMPLERIHSRKLRSFHETAFL